MADTYSIAKRVLDVLNRETRALSKDDYLTVLEEISDDVAARIDAVEREIENE